MYSSDKGHILGMIKKERDGNKKLVIHFSQYQNLKCSIQFLCGQQFYFVLTLFTYETNIY